MAIIFNQSVLHDRVRIASQVALAFEDERAEAYFINAGWAEPTVTEAAMTYPAAEIAIDPSAVHADGPKRGLPVLED